MLYDLNKFVSYTVCIVGFIHVHHPSIIFVRAYLLLHISILSKETKMYDTLMNTVNSASARKFVTILTFGLEINGPKPKQRF